jgi:hypothetical protein
MVRSLHAGVKHEPNVHRAAAVLYCRDMDSPLVRAPRTAIACLAVAAALAAFARLPALWGSVEDDAFIYFRIAANAARGLGPVFNLGERVDAATSPVWVWLLAAAARLGVPLPLAATTLGLLAGLGAIALAARWALELAAPRQLPAVLLAVLGPSVLVADARFLFWSFSGMETPLAALAWLAAMRALVRRWMLRTADRSAGWLALAACLVRPEFALFVMSIAAAALVRRTAPVREVARTLLPLAVGGLAYLAAHKLYFGDAFPNTWQAKRAADWTHARIGLAYLAVLPRAYPWLLLGLAAVAVPVLRGAALGLVLGMAVYTLHVASLGGDHFVFHRPYVPVLPACVAFAGAAAAHLWSARRRAGRVAVVAVSVAVLAAAAWQRVPPQPFAWVRVAAQLGHALARTYPPETRLGLFAIGAAGYTSGLPVVDALGLADRHVARRDLSREHACALDIGHERGDPAYVLERADVVALFGAYAPVPFESLDEVREAFYSHKKFLAAAKEAVKDGRWRLRNLDVAPGTRWLVLEKVERVPPGGGVR